MTRWGGRGLRGEEAPALSGGLGPGAYAPGHDTSEREQPPSFPAAALSLESLVSLRIRVKELETHNGRRGSTSRHGDRGQGSSQGITVRDSRSHACLQGLDVYGEREGRRIQLAGSDGQGGFD